MAWVMLPMPIIFVEIGKTMRAFFTECRKGKYTIYEIEYEKVLPLQDPSVLWTLRPGEFKFNITAPAVLYNGGKDNIYMSFALLSSLEEATTSVVTGIRYEMTEFQVRKNREPATEEAVQAAIAEIKTVML